MDQSGSSGWVASPCWPLGPPEPPAQPQRLSAAPLHLKASALTLVVIGALALVLRGGGDVDDARFRQLALGAVYAVALVEVRSAVFISPEILMSVLIDAATNVAHRRCASPPRVIGTQAAFSSTARYVRDRRAPHEVRGARSRSTRVLSERGGVVRGRAARAVVGLAAPLGGVRDRAGVGGRAHGRPPRSSCARTNDPTRRRRRTTAAGRCDASRRRRLAAGRVVRTSNLERTPARPTVTRTVAQMPGPDAARRSLSFSRFDLENYHYETHVRTSGSGKSRRTTTTRVRVVTSRAHERCAIGGWLDASGDLAARWRLPGRPLVKARARARARPRRPSRRLDRKAAASASLSHAHHLLARTAKPSHLMSQLSSLGSPVLPSNDPNNAPILLIFFSGGAGAVAPRALVRRRRRGRRVHEAARLVRRAPRGGHALRRVGAV